MVEVDLATVLVQNEAQILAEWLDSLTASNVTWGARLTFEDHGPGIAEPNELPRLAKPFRKDDLAAAIYCNRCRQSAGSRIGSPRDPGQ